MFLTLYEYLSTTLQRALKQVLPNLPEGLKASPPEPATSSGFPYVNYNREFQKILCLAPRLEVGGT